MANDDRTYYVICNDRCLFEGMTKEQIIAAIAEATGATPTQIDDAFITKIKEQNANKAVKFWIGTTAEYNAITTKATDCFYMLTDDDTEEEIDNSITELTLAISNITDGTTTVGKATNANNVKAKDDTYKTLANAMLEMIYPVGSIYMSVTNNNPSTFLGGTWEAWGAGRVPVGVDADQTEFDTAEETGGEKEHTLTTSEIPSHTHSYQKSTGTVVVVTEQSTGTNTTSESHFSSTTNATGGGEAHNNLQPYITCYMFKRTA